MDRWVVVVVQLLLFVSTALLQCITTACFQLPLASTVRRRRHTVCFVVKSDEAHDFQPFRQAYDTLGFNSTHCQYDALEQTLKNGGVSNSGILQTICRDYYESQQMNPAKEMIQKDFGLTIIQAHITRSILWSIYKEQDRVNRQEEEACVSEVSPSIFPMDRAPPDHVIGRATAPSEVFESLPSHAPKRSLESQNETITMQQTNSTENEPKRLLYKEVSLRNKKGRASPATYGVDVLPDLLESQLQQYYHEFMIRSNPYHPSSTPLRAPTARTYLTHARLFLGWYMASADGDNATSLVHVIPDNSRQSVNAMMDFIRFLREERSIASSYEANVWRGLTKLLQFRFSMLISESMEDDIIHPAILQVRKWHRQAMQNAKNAPRRSREDKKWLSWPQFLTVVKQCRNHVQDLLQEYEPGTSSDAFERKIGIAMQKYLILAIFATVPDRQRTIRELQLDESLIQDENGIWCIYHSADSYKTGKTYGERPLLPLRGITPDLTLFIDEWRCKLKPSTEYLFVQSRTGNPLTRDSVYQIVGRTCFQYTGQKTNPHLLRDMIVTHVRENPTTSEQELEALALLMGHSLAVQRSSYDRRTLSQKVAPAVSLLEKVNGAEN